MKIRNWLLAFVCSLSFLAVSDSALARQCWWVKGHWNHGHWIPGHKVCVGGHKHKHCKWIPGHWFKGHWIPGHKICWWRH